MLQQINGIFNLNFHEVQLFLFYDKQNLWYCQLKKQSQAKNSVGA